MHEDHEGFEKFLVPFVPAVRPSWWTRDDAGRGVGNHEGRCATCTKTTKGSKNSSCPSCPPPGLRGGRAMTRDAAWVTTKVAARRARRPRRVRKIPRALRARRQAFVVDAR